MNAAAKPPIYRSKSKAGKPDSKASDSDRQVPSLKRHLSIPNVDCRNLDLGVPGTSLERSSSLSNINNLRGNNLSTRSLSASNILALSDPNLSLREAKPRRSYDAPSNESAREKTEYTAFSQMYFHQLTDGCKNMNCKNKFCKSCFNNVLTKYGNGEYMAIVFSMELAKSKDKFLCRGCNRKTKIFPNKLLKNDKPTSLPIMCSLSTTTPFRSLYLPCPLSSSDSHVNVKIVNGSVSNGNLGDLNTHISQSHFGGKLLSSLNKLSSGITSFWKSTDNISAENKMSQTNSENLHHDKTDGNMFRDNNKAKDQCLFGDETYIASSENLKEFEMSVASELKQSSSSDDDIKELSLTHLTLEMVQHMIDAYRQCQDPGFILNTIRTVFSSSESLNASFLSDNANAVRSRIHQIKPQVNRSDLAIAYTEIQTSDNGQFMSTLVDSILLLLSGLALKTSNIEEINQFIIILELPIFFDLNLPFLIAEILSNLSTRTRKRFISELSKYDQVGFQRLLKVSWLVFLMVFSK